MGIMKRIAETKGKSHDGRVPIQVVLAQETARAKGSTVRRFGSFAQNELDFGEVPSGRVQSRHIKVGCTPSDRAQRVG